MTSLDTELVTVALAGLAAGGATAALCRGLLPRLSEPADGDGKVAYRNLPTRRFVLTTSVAAAVTAALVPLGQPVPVRPLWWVLTTLGVLLAAVDAVTTWLPLSLTRVAWSAMVLAALLVLPLGGGSAVLFRVAVGAATAFALYYLVRLVSRGGFGFGDVRFAPLLGAAAAATAYGLLLWALTLGAVVGAVHGIVRLVGRRPGPFPYAPAMLAGTFLAAGLWAATAAGG